MSRYKPLIKKNNIAFFSLLRYKSYGF